ncbi:MAG: DNA-3-methyladenine glycosylase [Myxococcales bacterium]|nr:DNA-3-methyladenine glycosylase [Myxococcales bacterium]
MNKPFPFPFYETDPLELARVLLGARLTVRDAAGIEREGIVVETEAYRGEEDLACHARAGKTPRTEIMYGPGGFAYVYLIYGMYQMLNVTAWPEGKPAAVLVRAVEPIGNIAGRTNGPGRLTKTLQIHKHHNGLPFVGPELKLTPDWDIQDSHVGVGPRIGVEYAGDWAHKPWRFFIADNPHVSVRPKKGIKVGNIP